jgi:hypothetical protein
MKEIEKLPSAFDRFYDLHGVLHFAVFENANGTVEEILSAVPQALGGACTYNVQALRLQGGRRIAERTFFGDWYDHETGTLLKLGISPDVDEGGQFAYAFSSPPLRAARNAA